MTPRRNRRARHATLVPALLAALVAVAGCAIQPDGSPRAISEEERGDFGDDPATGGAATGSSLVYLLAPGESGQPQLRSVMRGVPPQTEDVLRTLLKGPNSIESLANLGSAIPADLELNFVRQVGPLWIIDVNDGLDELDAVDLRTALAQIVATATAIDDVKAVQIRVNGENRSWPKGDGTLTNEALTPYDFPGMVESTQPPYPSLSSATR